MDFMNEYVNGQLASPQFVNPYEEAATYERAERTGKSRRLTKRLRNGQCNDQSSYG